MEGKKKRLKNPMDAQKVFPRRLTKLMKDQKTTQTALAERLGVTRQAVANYCDGSSTPSWEGIAEIARFFNCSADYLLGLSEYSNHSLEQITLAELGLNEAAIENLEFHCKNLFRASVNGIKLPETKDGINLLMGNDSFWDRDLFLEIAGLQEFVSNLKKIGKYDIHRLKLFSLDDGTHTDKENFSLSSMDYLDLRIVRIGDYFTDSVKEVIGYYELYDQVYHGVNPVKPEE